MRSVSWDLFHHLFARIKGGKISSQGLPLCCLDALPVAPLRRDLLACQHEVRCALRRPDLDPATHQRLVERGQLVKTRGAPASLDARIGAAIKLAMEERQGSYHFVLQDMRALAEK